MDHRPLSPNHILNNISPGSFVTILAYIGPADAPSYRLQDIEPNALPCPTTREQVHLMIPPGLPLKVIAYDYPILAVAALGCHRTTRGPILLDTRNISLKRCSPDFVNALLSFGAPNEPTIIGGPPAHPVSFDSPPNPPPASVATS